MPIRILFPIFLLICPLFFCSSFLCNPQASIGGLAQWKPNDLPSRRQLFRALRERGVLYYIYSESDTISSRQFRSLADSLEKLPGGERNSIRIEPRGESGISAEELAGNPILLVGRHFVNPAVQALADQLPVSPKSMQGFQFDGRDFTQPHQTYKVSIYPNPLNPVIPLSIISGNSPEAIAQLILRNTATGWGGLFWSSWGYEIYDQNQAILLGDFREDSWQVDPQTRYDFSQSKDITLATPHFTFIDHGQNLREEQLMALATTCESTLDSLQAILDVQVRGRPVTYHIYSSLEEKGLRLMNTDAAQVDVPERTVHVVISPEFRGDEQQKENYIFIREVLGLPSKPFLETGLAVFFSRQWHKRGFRYWAGHLFHSGNLPPASELLSDDLFSGESPLVMECSAAAFVEFLLNEWGTEQFLERYRQWKPLSTTDLQALQHRWESFLKEDPSYAVSSAKMNRPLPFLQGFNFAHEGYRIYNGYGSEQARRSLARLLELGSNAVAIIPYGFMARAGEPSFLSVVQMPGGENDESVIHAHRQAQKMGMHTLLKPQIWVRGAWPGEVNMPSETDWKRFFEYYYRWIRHYALLAEMESFDLFCLGVEFTRATRTHPQEWRALLARIRGIYSGPVTYAANWGEEFEQLSFWADFDFIGLDCYYPLSPHNEASRDELSQAFREVLKGAAEVSRRYGKPLLFTEIGFSSVTAPWKNPHEDGRDRPFDGEAQRLCYEAVLENIAGQDWIAGLLWWKWPSYLDYRGRDGKDFSPHQKPAEIAVREWFGRERKMKPANAAQ